MDTSALETLAGRQWRDRQLGTPGTMFADPGLSLTLDEAYNIQMEFAGLRCAGGDAVVGYKVGCIGPGVVEQFGMSGPIHARLFRSELHRSGTTLRHKDYANPAIEGEMAFRIGVDGEIAAAFPVIELHQLRRRRRTSGSDADVLARLTHLPGIVWVGFFLVVDVGALAVGAWLLLRL